MDDIWEQARQDAERRQAKREQQKQDAQKTIAALMAELEELLEQPPNPDILEQQATTMDALMRAVLRANLKRDKESGYIDHDHIMTALKIQKQCMNTVKTKAAMDYMNALSPPRPLKIEKQTSQTE